MFTPKNKRRYWVNEKYQRRCPNRSDRKVVMVDEAVMLTFREATKVVRILKKYPRLKTAVQKIDEAIYISQRY